MYSDHKLIKVVINSRKILKNSPNIWKLKNTFLSHP